MCLMHFLSPLEEWTPQCLQYCEHLLHSMLRWQALMIRLLRLHVLQSQSQWHSQVWMQQYL